MEMMTAALIATLGLLLPSAPLPRYPRCRISATADAISPGALAVLSLPGEPLPQLSASDVVGALCLGLQYAHVPTQDDGLRRLFNFTTYECRAALTTRKGYKSGPEKFVQHAELWSLPGCRSFSVCGEASIIPATQTRGALASVAVEVIEQVGFRYKSGFERRKPAAMEAAEPQTQSEHYRITLAQERRPPLAGCWRITSMLPMRQHMLFNGDSGAVQG